MPRNVRNFWLTLDVDGKKTGTGTGPVGKFGGFELDVKMRDQGEVTSAGILRGIAMNDGRLMLQWLPATSTNNDNVLLPLATTTRD